MVAGDARSNSPWAGFERRRFHPDVWLWEGDRAVSSAGQSDGLHSHDGHYGRTQEKVLCRDDISRRRGKSAEVMEGGCGKLMATRWLAHQNRKCLKPEGVGAEKDFSKFFEVVVRSDSFSALGAAHFR